MRAAVEKQIELGAHHTRHQSSGANLQHRSNKSKSLHSAVYITSSKWISARNKRLLFFMPPVHAMQQVKKVVLPRDMLCKRGLCRHAVSVCLSVCLSICLSRLYILSKRIMCLHFFHRRVTTSF